MPPSRGLRPVSDALRGIYRQPIVSRTSVRTLSSAPTFARHGTRARMIAPSSSLPVTGYILHNGRANLSLWPFSKEKASATATPPEALSQSPSEALSSSTSHVQEAASSLVDKAESSLQSAANAASATSEILSESIAPATTSDSAPILFDNITEIGQLEELGLQYAWWGPTTWVESVVEHIHVYAGTPWWGTIALSAVAIRLLFIYPFFKMSEHQARWGHIMPQVKPIMERQKIASVTGDKQAQAIAAKEIGRLKMRNGVSMGWMFAPILLQAVFGFGAFKLTRAMAALPVPGFETGGVAWMTNLSVADPTYITPISMWIFMHMLSRTTIDTSTSSDPAMAAMTRPLALYILPTLMFAATFWQPAALQISFLVATIFGTLQNLLFRNPPFRSLMGMTPLPLPPGKATSPASSSSAGVPPPTTPSAGASREIPSSSPDAFRTNPFANLNIARPKGAAFEAGIRYQAPTAASTLQAVPQKASADLLNNPPEVPKKDSFVSREIKNAKSGLAQFMDGAKEKLSQRQQNAMKPGDRGRDPKMVQQNRAYEAKRRERATYGSRT